MYTYTYADAANTILLRSDGVHIPVDEGNTDYQEFAQNAVDVAPFVPLPVVHTISKADIWRALTELEAEAVDAVLTNPVLTPVRLRRVFEAAQFISTDDPDYPALRAGLIAAIGEERTDEILPQL